MNIFKKSAYFLLGVSLLACNYPNVIGLDLPGSARFTISSAKAFEIRHFSSHTQATTGFGPSFSSSDATTAGGVAIFTIVEIYKEA